MASWHNSKTPLRLGGSLVLVAVLACANSARAVPATYAERVAPVLERHCAVCHGEKKTKAGLRLDSYAAILRGAESGSVLKPGDLKGSELHRRITLPTEDEEFMPSDGKPPLSPADVLLLEKWIAAGAPETQPFDAPALAVPLVVLPAAPDWRPRAKEIAALEAALGIRLTPRSAVATDGLILRTASAPGRCDDAALPRLGPVADLIVDAELGRTKITDAGLKSLAGFVNLRRLDLTRTAVTSAGLAALGSLKALETLNLTDTAVDGTGMTHLQTMPALRRVWLFGTPAAAAGVAWSSPAP
jgi:hypothetical protein